MKRPAAILLLILPAPLLAHGAEVVLMIGWIAFFLVAVAGLIRLDSWIPLLLFWWAASAALYIAERRGDAPRLLLASALSLCIALPVSLGCSLLVVFLWAGIRFW